MKTVTGHSSAPKCGPGRVGLEFVWIGSGPKKLTRVQKCMLVKQRFMWRWRDGIGGVGYRLQGRSDGGWISVFIPPKSAQVNFYGVKMTSERLFNSFVPPPRNKKNKFLATPLTGY